MHGRMSLLSSGLEPTNSVSPFKGFCVGQGRAASREEVKSNTETFGTLRIFFLLLHFSTYFHGPAITHTFAFSTHGQQPVHAFANARPILQYDTSSRQTRKSLAVRLGELSAGVFPLSYVSNIDLIPF
jgi:hypothetical protein